MSVVTADSRDDSVLHSIETSAMAAGMKTPLVHAFLSDLAELTVHGTDFRLETTYPAER